VVWPFLLIKTGADLLDSTPEQTVPKSMSLSARGARPSPSTIVASANATAGKASMSANVIIKSRENLLVNLARIFDSPLFVVFPADLLSIPSHFSLEALVSSMREWLPGGNPGNVIPRGYPWEAVVIVSWDGSSSSMGRGRR
jgi:hypothetical protein